METNMVKTLKSNEEYMEYIKEKVSKVFPNWQQTFCSDAIDGRFGITYTCNGIIIFFVKDYFELLVNIKKEDKRPKSYLSMYDNIVNTIPVKQKEWYTAISVNLIDYYIDFLKENLNKLEFEE